MKKWALTSEEANAATDDPKKKAKRPFPTSRAQEVASSEGERQTHRCAMIGGMGSYSLPPPLRDCARTRSPSREAQGDE